MAANIALRSCTPADWHEFEDCMQSAFGNEISEEGRRSWEPFLDPERMLVATDQDIRGAPIVGTAGWLPFDMTVPGGEIPVAAVTMVTVRPTHRRQGILRQMMQRQLADLHAEGLAVATLWASESVIYARFGYGLGYVKGRIEIDPRRAELLGRPDPVGRPRHVSPQEALELMPEVYERARREIPGSFRRSREWWEQRKVADPPSMRWGGGPMTRMVLEIDGRAEGYALYRVFPGYGPDALPTHVLEVLEAVGTTPVATREVWRYLFGVDLIALVRTHRLNSGHPLFLSLTDPRQLRMIVGDGTWVRLVDVGAALAARRYGSESGVTFELADPTCPWNPGVWTLEAGADGAAVRKSYVEPELRLAANDLSAMYLGTVACTSLVRAGRVEELRPGAASRADSLFRSDVAPWCLDDF